MKRKMLSVLKSIYYHFNFCTGGGLNKLKENWLAVYIYTPVLNVIDEVDKIK